MWPAPTRSKSNVTIYHTINGRRTEKKRASMKVPANQWQTLRVDAQGNHFTVSLNCQKALDWDDDTFKDARLLVERAGSHPGAEIEGGARPISIT
jgi:Domain of Unknown Function (DUF1080)